MGMSGAFSPPPRVSDPDMHHMHPWSMPWSLTNGFSWSRWREIFPGIPGVCGTRNLTYLVRGPRWELIPWCISDWFPIFMQVHSLYLLGSWRLIPGSRDMWKPNYWILSWLYHFKIWQVPLRQCSQVIANGKSWWIALHWASNSSWLWIEFLHLCA